MTIFLNSHQLAEVEATCGEVAILRKGRVALTGRVKELTAGKGYRVTALGVPEALITELRGTVHEGEVTIQFSTREGVNAALDQLRAAHSEVESVIPTTSTLEEIFVKTLEAKQ